jgi:hypothetical protein
MIQKRRKRLRIRRHLQGQHAGAIDRHIRAVNRVVIDEDETVQAEIELGRERGDV